MATIRQVAKEAGVSIATVSRILSGDSGFTVKDDTREKVLAAADRLGYSAPSRPSIRYRFGCILSQTADAYSDPFFTDILLAMEAEGRDMKAGIVISKSYREIENPAILQEFLDANLDGVFIMERIKPEIMDLISSRIPHIVLIDNNDPFYEFDNIGFDHRTANWQVMDELFKRGYRRIAMISGTSPEEPLKSSIRYLTYLEALSREGLPYDESIIKDCEWDLNICERQVRELMAMQDRPDAIFAGSDSLASVVLGTLFALGIKCPEDVGVIGFNNIQLSAHMVPPLSTIEIPTHEIGRTAMRRMMRIITGGESAVRRVLFPTRIVSRSSLRERQ